MGRSERIRLVIYGRPVSQKNTRQLVTHHGRPMSLPNTGVREWHKSAAQQLAIQARVMPDLPLDADGSGHAELPVEILICQGSGQHLDADNAAAAPLDALKKAGIVSSDYWCNPLHITRMRDDTDPRVEITIGMPIKTRRTR